MAQEYATDDAMALTALVVSDPVELAFHAWLHEKYGRSGSERTRDTYATTFAGFREALRMTGLDLTSDPAVVALAAQGWAARPRARDGQPVTANTYNQRLAIISSFYTFARKRGFLTTPNPMEPLARRPVQDYASARPLDAAIVAQRLTAIDRRTPAGLRDYALLALALQTGRRLSELAALTWGDLTFAGGRVTVTWRHAKGGKVMYDELTTPLTHALLAWLHAAYDIELDQLAPDAPLWISLAYHCPGHALTLQSIADICARRMGVSKVHALRHSFAHAMEALGAKVSEIQARLGHSSLATTGLYLAALNAATNPHADAISALFGIVPDGVPSSPFPVVEQATTPQPQEEPDERSDP